MTLSHLTETFYPDINQQPSVRSDLNKNPTTYCLVLSFQQLPLFSVWFCKAQDARCGLKCSARGQLTEQHLLQDNSLVLKAP